MVFGVIVVGGLGASAFAVFTAGSGEAEVDTVAVERGEIVDRALAVGRIEPLVEVSVKSQLAGVVRRMFKEPGQYVHRGEPLLEVQPNPTPIELVEARRAIELREIELQQLDRRRDRWLSCATRSSRRRRSSRTPSTRSAKSRSSSRSPGSAWPCSRKGA